MWGPTTSWDKGIHPRANNGNALFKKKTKTRLKRKKKKKDMENGVGTLVFYHLHKKKTMSNVKKRKSRHGIDWWQTVGMLTCLNQLVIYPSLHGRMEATGRIVMRAARKWTHESPFFKEDPISMWTTYGKTRQNVRTTSVRQDKTRPV